MRAANLLLVCVVITGAAAQKAKTKKPTPSNQPLIIKSFTATGSTVLLCPFFSVPELNETTLRTQISNAEADNVSFTYIVPVGRIEGTGPTVFWNLQRQPAGTYQAVVIVEDRKGNKARATVTINAVDSGACDPPPPPCPVVTVSCPTDTQNEKSISFIANVEGVGLRNVSYEWVTTAGRIVEGKFGKKMTLDLSGLPFEPVTATVSIGGADPSCTGTKASCTIRITQ